MRGKCGDVLHFLLRDTRSVEAVLNWRDRMMQIFLVQFLAAALGAASTAMADWLYHSGRIRQYLHAIWVSTSIAVICLPILEWVCNVFLGSGLPGQLVAGILVGTIFLWVYRKLRKLPPVQNLGPRPPRRSSSGAVPPASKLNG